jgi:hypothetical protein
MRERGREGGRERERGREGGRERESAFLQYVTFEFKVKA